MRNKEYEFRMPSGHRCRNELRNRIKVRRKQKKKEG